MSCICLKEHFHCFFQATDQAIDLLKGVINGETGTNSTWNVIKFHYWLRTVVASAYGYTHLVKECTYIVRVGSIDIEGEYPCLAI